MPQRKKPGFPCARGAKKCSGRARVRGRLCDRCKAHRVKVGKEVVKTLAGGKKARKKGMRKLRDHLIDRGVEKAFEAIWGRGARDRGRLIARSNVVESARVKRQMEQAAKVFEAKAAARRAVSDSRVRPSLEEAMAERGMPIDRPGPVMSPVSASTREETKAPWLDPKANSLPPDGPGRWGERGARLIPGEVSIYDDERGRSGHRVNNYKITANDGHPGQWSKSIVGVHVFGDGPNQRMLTFSGTPPSDAQARGVWASLTSGRADGLGQHWTGHELSKWTYNGQPVIHIGDGPDEFTTSSGLRGMGDGSPGSADAVPLDVGGSE